MKRLLAYCILLLPTINRVHTTNTPAQVVQEYYYWYLTCIEKSHRKPCYYYQPSDRYLTTNLLKRLKEKEFIEEDYFTKSQDLDSNYAKQTFKIKKVKAVNKKLVQVMATMKYTQSPEYKGIFTITTQKEGNIWKISEVKGGIL